jgi:hypothetical protein
MTAEFVRDAAATAAVVAVPLARSRALAVSAVTGLVTGTVLLAAALFSTASVLLSG